VQASDAEEMRHLVHAGLSLFRYHSERRLTHQAALLVDVRWQPVLNAEAKAHIEQN
jgi:hypothetical protein